MIKIAVDADHPDQLNVNDVQLYPSHPLYPPQPIYAKQVEADESLVDIKTAGDDGEPDYQALRLGFVSVVEKTVDFAHVSDETEILRLDFQVSSLEDKAVDGLDKIKATVLKTPDGKLMIARVELEPSAPVAEGPRCTGPPILCKIKALMMGGIHKVKMAFHHCKMALHQCKHKMMFALHRLHHHHHEENHHHGAMHHGGKPCPHHPGMRHGVPGFGRFPPIAFDAPVTAEPAPRVVHISIPEHHEFQNGHSYKHRVIFTILRATMQTVAALLFGALIGMLVGFVGLAVGHIVVYAWRLYRSRKAARYSTVAQEETHSDDDDGDSEMAAEDKPFLDAESLPAYEAHEEVEVLEKKE